MVSIHSGLPFSHREQSVSSVGKWVQLEWSHYVKLGNTSVSFLWSALPTFYMQIYVYFRIFILAVLFCQSTPPPVVFINLSFICDWHTLTANFAEGRMVLQSLSTVYSDGMGQLTHSFPETFTFSLCEEHWESSQ